MGDTPHYLLRVFHGAASSFSVTRHPGQVLLTINDVGMSLSPRQSDLLAQAIFMSALRTESQDFVMPWEQGKIFSVNPVDAISSGMRINYADFCKVRLEDKFFCSGWLYESEGADPDFPSNVVFIRTRQDDVIELIKGNDFFLLSANQAAQIYLELAVSGDSLSTRTWRTWRIWDKQIEWSVECSSANQALSAREREDLYDYLKSYVFPR